MHGGTVRVSYTYTDGDADTLGGEKRAPLMYRLCVC